MWSVGFDNNHVDRGFARDFYGTGLRRDSAFCISKTSCLECLVTVKISPVFTREIMLMGLAEDGGYT